MAPHEIRVPFPLDMMGDLDTTLRYVEDRHLVDSNAEASHERYHPLRAAVHAIKSAIASYRAKAADEAVSLDHIPLERSHLATLMDFSPDVAEQWPEAHRAAGNVSEWLDRDI